MARFIRSAHLGACNGQQHAQLTDQAIGGQGIACMAHVHFALDGSQSEICLDTCLKHLTPT